MTTLPISIAPSAPTSRRSQPSSASRPTIAPASDEPDQVAAGRAEDHVEPPLPSAKNGSADDPISDVQPDARERRDGSPSAPPTSRTPNVWPVTGTGVPGIGIDEPRGQRAMSSAPSDDQGDVRGRGCRSARRAAIGTRKSAIVRPRSVGRQPVQARRGDRHRATAPSEADPVPRLPRRLRAAGRVYHRPYSCWTAATIARRLASRAGYHAASIETPTPRTTASADRRATARRGSAGAAAGARP